MNNPPLLPTPPPPPHGNANFSWIFVDPVQNSNKSQDSRYVPKPKFELPIFAGEDVKGRIYRTEQMLDYYNIQGEQRVKVAAMHLEGSSLQWYRWLLRTKKTTLLWPEFEAGIVTMYDEQTVLDSAGVLSKL